ncbi:hypothetical protein [Aquimarina sp. AU58]|uniref:hypothetical protein n=1 Tax=Aquimarina sp. AU58 TaxID=1874112 RepID=UPI000D6DDD36|nr:hypothetical protein [Aquimarina sp. AU58]
MIELKIEWQKFAERIKVLYEYGETILNTNPKGKQEEEKFVDKYNLWRKKVLNELNIAFEENNQYSYEFKSLNNNEFKIPGQSSNNQEINVRSLKQKIRNELSYLYINKNLWRVSDLIIKPLEIDLNQRSNYTSEEIIDLILDKLYDLYDDNFYAILPILEGNGIILKKRREEFDYVNTLMNTGYINSQGIARQADAQLTLEGKLYIEQKRKLVTPIYDSISDNKEDINRKLDEIIKELQKLGFGQQIIFEEIEELRDLYSNLNKKNWGQLVKGKLLDLVLNQVINKDIMLTTYNHITGDNLQIP